MTRLSLYLRTGALGLVLATAAGCEHADPLGASDELEPTLSSIQANILDIHCATSGCHGSNNPQLGLDLSAGATLSSAVNVRAIEAPNRFRIDPGNPDDSYLVLKIEGDDDIVGERMPRGRMPLADEEIQAIRAWIADGAPDN